MKFGWINLWGAGIVLLMLIPNVLYAIKNKGERNLCSNRLMNVLEQSGRYGCMIFMVVPLFVWEFGFGSVGEMLVYLIGNGLLLAAYGIVYAFYFGKKTRARAMALTILPVLIFLLCGILLRHWLLVCFAILFAVGHPYVTAKNLSASV